MTRPSLAALVAFALAVVACSAGPGTGGELEGTDWVLRSYEDGSLAVVPEDQYANARFRRTGCSASPAATFDALYRAGGDALVSESASTLKACSEEAMDFEAAYLAALDQPLLHRATKHADGLRCDRQPGP